ncbi:MAG: aromatic amino acid ammonia-lyase, partial [Muribaculaceae bacterium]|nr:aromatic amino acid ammonia-lyase [Muribaculaceae bacterium]
MKYQISNEILTIEKVGEILDKNIKLSLSKEAIHQINRCREFLDDKIEHSSEPIYGITTGFGSLCNISIGKEDLSKLQENLVKSHACGCGEQVDKEIVRIMLLTKIKSLSFGNSGVQLSTVQRLVDLFNEDVIPVVYQQGSLGASGDLAPLANMCLPLLGLGEVHYKGEIRPAGEVMKELGWMPVSLTSKEGLALLNGTQFMSSHAVYGLLKLRKLSALADKIGALSLDVFDGRIEPFGDEVNAVRPHPGQLATARAVRHWLEGSEMIDQPKKHVQDPYSFRCMPQVHGAVKDAIDYVGKV